MSLFFLSFICTFVERRTYYQQRFFFLPFWTSFGLNCRIPDTAICISLNKNSNYCYVPRSSKHTGTCKWLGRVFCNRSRLLLLSFAHFTLIELIKATWHNLYAFSAFFFESWKHHSTSPFHIFFYVAFVGTCWITILHKFSFILHISVFIILW